MSQLHKTGKLISPMDEMEDDREDDTEDSDSSGNEETEDEDLDALERRTMELKNWLTESPFVYEHHLELIKCLEKLGELEQLRSARKEMHAMYPLSEELWLSWLRDEVKYCENKKELISLFDDAVKDYLSIKIWLEYCQFAIGSLLSDSPEQVRNVLDRALAACGNHVITGNQIWEVSREFELAMLQLEQSKADSSPDSDSFRAVNVQKNRIDGLFKAQLTLPHFEMDLTFKEYCEWLGDKEPDVATKNAFQRAKKMYEDRQQFEDSLIESDPPAVDAYTNYLDFEEKTGDPTRVACLYERAIADHPLVEEFWRHYTAYMERKTISGPAICALYQRAVRNVLWSAELWIKWAQALERANAGSHTEISKVFEDALQASFQKEADVSQVWIAYLDYLRRRICWSEDHEKELDELRKCFSRAEESMNAFQDRREHMPTLLKYWAFVEAKFCQNVAKARQLWHMVTRLGRGSEADLWLEYVSFERAFGDSPVGCISVLQSALNAVVDRPEAICAAYINFAREACTLEQLDEAIAACEKRKALLQKRAKEQSEKLEKNKASGKGSKHTGLGYNKGKGGNEATGANVGHEPPKFVKPGQKGGKKAENVRFDGGDKRKYDKNIPPSEGESPFKKPCAPVPPAKTSNNAPAFKEPTMPPPLSLKSQGVPATSTQIRSEDTSTTVFLSNLDFTVTEDEVRNFFKDCGTIESVRLVMKTQKLNRGFAYICFADADGASKALALDRQNLHNRPAFVSPYAEKSATSEGDAMEKKSGLIYPSNLEKNKLFVRGVPFSCTEQLLKNVFGAHGQLKAARLVTFKDGKPKGLAYVEFENATDAEKARQALNGSAALGEGKILTVEISNPPAKRPTNEMGSSSANARKGAVAAFYSNLGVGSRFHSTGKGQQTRISVPTQSSEEKASASGNGTAEKPKMSNDDFRKFLSK